jgi:putative hemolysin
VTTGLLVAIGAILVAALCAAADSAALGVEEDGEPPSLPRGTYRAHRVYSFTKLAAQLIAGAAAARALGLHERGGDRLGAGTVLALIIIAILVVEAVARSVGAATGAATDRTLGWLRPALERVLVVYLWPAAQIDGVLRRFLAPPPPTAVGREETSEQFKAIVSAEADVSGLGAKLLEGALSLGTTSVAEIMVPRVDILGIDIATPWTEVVDRLRSAEHARLPVYAETLDEMRGVLYAKDVLAAAIEGVEPDGDWRTSIRPATFIPATKMISELLSEFRATQTHMALVVDEYGGIAGLVTIEDILEEIVGEIRDEHDVEEPDVARREAGRVWVSGRASLDDLSTLLGHEFSSEDGVTTVGGWVYEHLGRVPRPGEEFVAEGFRVVVERIRRRAVDRVYFERTAPVAEETTAG